MSIKPTLRQNGKHMATITVKRHIDGELIAACLAHFEYFNWRDDVGEDGELGMLTKREVEVSVREAIRYSGLSWVDEMKDSLDWEEAFAWGMRHVRKYWPEMAAKGQE